ncbi:MAG: glycosidase [Puniceicoccaceae bacterium]
MTSTNFTERLARLQERHAELINRPNKIDDSFYNGIYDRYEYPVLTAEHTPLDWQYDLNPETNPYLQVRMGMNAALNPGAIYWDGKYVLCARMEGVDRKSFFALAESDTGIDGFQMKDKPMQIPEADRPDVNLYDMRLTAHEDGYVYGVFCTERPDANRAPGDLSSAEAQCGIIRSKDLESWERLPDLITSSPQQRNAVLHPEFVNGKYAVYTRPQDGFIDAGSGGGIGLGFCESMENPELQDEVIIDERAYHTVNESKNGQGPAPIKTDKGWLHLCHGVRGTAAGLRYVLYVIVTDLDDVTKVIAKPGGYFIAPIGSERVGDVSNVAFANGWIANENGDVFIYYASSDTRCHVATSTVDRLVDYAFNTPVDGLSTKVCVEQRIELIEKNRRYLDS